MVRLSQPVPRTDVIFGYFATRLVPDTRVKLPNTEFGLENSLLEVCPLTPGPNPQGAEEDPPVLVFPPLIGEFVDLFFDLQEVTIFRFFVAIGSLTPVTVALNPV